MLEIQQVDTTSRLQVEQFVQLPFRLYANCQQWVPPIISDIKLMLNKNKHPFYELNDADFFMAVRDGKVVGRLSVAENRSFNQYHDCHKVQFYLFECEDDQEVANKLFERGFEWARARKLNEVVGPKGFSAFDGYGIQVEGQEHRQMMTMMNYNHLYYARLVEAIGFEKEVDFVSCYLDPKTFHIPDKVREVARRVKERGSFEIRNFRSKRDLMSHAWEIGEAYNKTFINNWEYYPLTRGEIKLLVDNLMVVADPRLIKIISYKGEMVGFLFAFADISAALQRARGHLWPWNIADLMLELRRTKWVSLNGAGVLPQYHGRGGNALMYSEMEDTLRNFNFEHGELTQVAETAVQMRKDLITVGGKPYKNHRIYHKKI